MNYNLRLTTKNLRPGFPRLLHRYVAEGHADGHGGCHACRRFDVDLFEFRVIGFHDGIQQAGRIDLALLGRQGIRQQLRVGMVKKDVGMVGRDVEPQEIIFGE